MPALGKLGTGNSMKVARLNYKVRSRPVWVALAKLSQNEYKTTQQEMALCLKMKSMAFFQEGSSFSFVVVTNAMAKSSSGQEGFIWLILPSPSLMEVKVGT